MITNQWIAQIGDAIGQACPLAANDETAMTDVRDKIREHIADTGQLPTELQVITSFCVPHENRLLQDQQNRDIAARKKARLDELSGPTREEAVAELRKLRGPGPARQQFVGEDLSRLSRNEYDKLSDAEIKRRQFGTESLGLNREGTKLNLHNPQNERDRYEREKILSYRGRDPVKRALKRELLDGSEQRDVQARRDALEQQEADRRAAIAALRAVKK